MQGWKAEFSRVVDPILKRSQVTRQIAVDQGALAQAGVIIRQNFEASSALIFADEAGFEAAGAQLRAALEASGLQVLTHVIASDPLPKASVELAESFAEILAYGDYIPVSLGSGVINDLVKHAAFQTDRAYASIATAASMDGYASAGAPLARDGFKITIPTRAPRVIIADLDVIAAAPPEMTGWGYGDLAGKSPAGGDWLLADAVGAEPLDSVAWPLVQNNLRTWLDRPEALASGDFASMARLFTGLTAVGFAMEFHGSSRPASGADHQIAHMWEMEGLEHAGRKVSHGACVAVGCQSALRLFDWLLDQDLEALDIDTVLDRAPELRAKFAEIDTLIRDPLIAERARAETEAKHVSQEVHQTRLAAIRANWPDLRALLQGHLYRAHEMATMLRQAGAPTQAADIGVSPAHHKATILASRFIRSRYTILDFLDDTGLLNRAVDALFPAELT